MRGETVNRRPVFVIGAPFSGAALLGWSLARHPALTPHLDRETVDSILDAVESLKRRLVPLIDVGVETLRESLRVGRSAENGRGAHVAAAGEFLGTVARLVVNGARNGNARRPRGVERGWVTAAPEYAFHVFLLSRLFPEGKFVHLIRSVEDVVRAGTQPGSPYTPQDVSDSWLRAVHACVDAERALGSDVVLRVQATDLERSPEAELRRCLEFLDQPFSDRCLGPLRALCRSVSNPLGRPSEPSGIPPSSRALSERLLRRRPRYRPSPTRLARLGEAAFPTTRDDATGVGRPPTTIRQLVAAVVPRGSTVLVVSKGDEELVRLDGQRGWHFPQTQDGVYAGYHPAASEEAIAHLEELQRQGAGFLLLPSSSSWWLDYYDRFRTHLERSARLVLDSDSCRIYRLEDGSPAGPQDRARRTAPTAARLLVREPDNAKAFRIIDRTAARRSRCTLCGELWAMTTFYNAQRYGNKSTNYRRFREGLHAAQVPLLTVEAAFGDAPFELTPADADILVQLRATDVLWQKERMLNIALDHLPERCDKVAWLDGDVLLLNAAWPSEVCRLLGSHQIVQPFSHTVRLHRDQSWCDPAALSFGLYEGQLFYGVAYGVHANGPATLPYFLTSGHTGYAWAARRSLLERHGFYDANPLGNGDMDIAQAMWGNRDYFAHRNRGHRAKTHLRRWARGFTAEVDGSVSFVEGLLIHLWHGDHQDRQYDQRIAAYANFAPATDLAIDPDTGLYRWKKAPPELIEWSRQYYRARKEE